MSWVIEIISRDCPYLGQNDECLYSIPKGEQARNNCERGKCPAISDRSLGYHDVEEFYKE